MSDESVSFEFLSDAITFTELYHFNRLRNLGQLSSDATAVSNWRGRVLQTEMLREYPQEWMYWLFDKVGTFYE